VHQIDLIAVVELEEDRAFARYCGVGVRDAAAASGALQKFRL